MEKLSVRLHNVKGIWKIDVSGAAVAKLPDAIRKQADAVEKIAKDVAAGEYHGIKEVADALRAAGFQRAR